MIWIRADANSRIGTGHVMRCLAIAAELRKAGEEVCFVAAEEETVSLLSDRGAACICLHTSYCDMDGELEVLLPLLQKEKPHLLLIDSYFVTEHYLTEVRRYGKTAYVDDRLLFPYPVDILLNYNIYGDKIPYKEKLPGKPLLLLGTEYAPLREEFKDVEYTVRERLSEVLITTGGSDRYNLAGKILEAALADEITGQMNYHVVSGAFNENLPMLQDLQEKHSNVQIHQNVKEMSALMKKCDAAVTAGGSTMYELCAVGVPIICFSFVDNQEEIVKTFTERELTVFGGNYLTEGDAMLLKVIDALKKLAENQETRSLYSSREKKPVDGRGAERIARILCDA